MKSIHCEDKKFKPSKVICIGRNYVDHIEELDNAIPEEPVIFLKPNSAITHEIDLTAMSRNKEEIHYEGEISFLVESGNITALGFGLDLTKRTVQSRLKNKGLPWERAKAFDGSAVFSPFKRFDGNMADVRLELYINGTLTQQGGCDLMLYKPDEILDDVQTFLTLENGDVIMTGTPAGVGKVHKSDEFVGKIYIKDQLFVEHTWIVN